MNYWPTSQRLFFFPSVWGSRSFFSQPGWCWSQQKVKGRFKGDIWTLWGRASLLLTKPCLNIVCVCVCGISLSKNSQRIEPHLSAFPFRVLTQWFALIRHSWPSSIMFTGWEKKILLGKELLLDDFFYTPCSIQLTLTSKMAYCFAYS